MRDTFSVSTVSKTLPFKRIESGEHDMLDAVKRFFSKSDENNSKHPGQQSGHDINVATCALFVEIARIDGKFTQEEMDKVLSILKKNTVYPDKMPTS